MVHDRTLAPLFRCAGVSPDHLRRGTLGEAAPRIPTPISARWEDKRNGTSVRIPRSLPSRELYGKAILKWNGAAACGSEISGQPSGDLLSSESFAACVPSRCRDNRPAPGSRHPGLARVLCIKSSFNNRLGHRSKVALGSANETDEYPVWFPGITPQQRTTNITKEAYSNACLDVGGCQ
jgi:hypothetical protein